MTDSAQTIKNKSIDSYKSFLIEKYRPPSKGGNTKALHQHIITVEGDTYSFLALGTKQWVYKSDSVSFDWEWDAAKKYRNIKKETIQTYDSKQHPVVRGHREYKKTLRIAQTRTPVSRREDSGFES